MAYLDDLIAVVAGRGAEGGVARLTAAEAAAGSADLAPLADELERYAGSLLHALEMLGDKANEAQARQISTALYCLCSAVFLAWEGVQIGARTGDWSRVVMAAMVIRHRLQPQDPLRVVEDPDDLVRSLILQETVSREQAVDYLGVALGGGK
jgi:hypothetical protein